MRRFLKWFHCAMSGHPMSITHLESIEGTLWATRETCMCGSKGVPIMPGGLFKAWKDHYVDFPLDYTDIY